MGVGEGREGKGRGGKTLSRLSGPSAFSSPLLLYYPGLPLPTMTLDCPCHLPHSCSPRLLPALFSAPVCPARGELGRGGQVG